MAAQNRADVEAAVSAFDNQLVAPGEPYAVLSAQPRPIDEVARYSPYRLSKIDGKELERPGYSLTRAMPLVHDLAFSELKVPPGVHDLTIAGGAIRHYATSISKVSLEAGKRYAIVEQMAPDGTVVVHISEYRQDKRFAPMDKEYYLIGKRVSDAVERGGSEVVDLGGATP
ncbi:MAG: hypothetical protein J7605_27530 [Variovorax sp.]|nr:hypothetical protein [Variovorax sp.]